METLGYYSSMRGKMLKWDFCALNLYNKAKFKQSINKVYSLGTCSGELGI